MRIALCNEMLAPLGFARQCAFAAQVGYDGLEVAPFTLDEAPHTLSGARRARLRRAAADAGIAISGLHWLLVRPAGLSITSGDAAVRGRTLEVMRRLVDFCAELGGTVLVHGSPAQRRLPARGDVAAARRRGIDAFATIAGHAERAGVTYCIEPLSPPQANFVTSLAEAVDIVRAVGSPALRAMLDCSATGRAEPEPPAALIDRWLPEGVLAHIHVNDPNRRGPGQGAMRFADVFRALQRHGYGGWAAVEPFDYRPDGPACAARAIGYVRGLLEGIA